MYVLLTIVLMISVKCAFGYIGCEIIDDEHLNWTPPRSDLIDRFPERSLYPAVPLNRSKRVIGAVSGPMSADFQAPRVRYLDPILAELKSAQKSQCFLSNGVYHQIKCVNDDDRKLVEASITINDDGPSRPPPELKASEAKNKIGYYDMDPDRLQ